MRRRFMPSHPKRTLGVTRTITVRFCSSLNSKNGNGRGFSQNLNLEKRYSHLFRIYAQKQEISEGKALHCHILKTIPKPNLFVSNSLANMYFKCRITVDARHVFDEISKPDVVSWNTMIGGYLLCGFSLEAFIFFRMMLVCGVVPDRCSFTSVLKGCIDFGVFSTGLQVHCTSVKFGLANNVFVGSGLVELYANFHSFDESVKVFDGLVFKDTILINTMIGVFSKQGNYKEAFSNFRLILSSSMVPTRATFINLLGAIDGYEMLRQGVLVHGLIIKFGFESDGVVENSLVGMYADCQAMHEAFDLLVDLGSKNVMSWTTLITRYANHGCFEDAMDLFAWIYHDTIVIDIVFLACILSISAASGSLHLGNQIHSIALKNGFESDSCVRDALMDMYAKCSSVGDMLKIFQQITDHPSICSWTTVISGYVCNGFPIEALTNFYQMQKEGMNPDLVACISVLMGCIDLQAIDQGEQIHAYVIKSGCKNDISLRTSLLSLYADCGCLESALKLFEKMIEYDVVAWTAMISCHARLGHNEEALVWLVKMFREGIKPNHFTLAATLSACSKLTATLTGKLLHTHIIKTGLKDDKFVGSAVIDMYSKCGSIQNAFSYFRETLDRDLVLWNALLAGHAHHGNGLEVLKVFDEMKNQGVMPDRVTFLAILSGCSHCGLVDKVTHYFYLMRDEFGISPGMEHYACAVDALGRAGMFKEAVEFIEVMEFEPGMVVLRTLLSSCIVYRFIKLGLSVVAKMFELGENDTATYVLLSNLYAIDGRWDEAQKVREVMERKFLRGKDVGKSCIESKSCVSG